jgi:spermidine synthase
MDSNLNVWLEDLFNGETGIKIRVRDCLQSVTTPFQRISVYDTVSFGRVLTLGGSIALTDKDEAVYAELLVHPALSVAKHPRKVLILGGGDGGLAREVLRYADVEQVTVVEIDRQVVEVCARWFPNCAVGLRDPRVKLVYDDAHRFLRETKDRFDVIIVDACELSGTPTEAFFGDSFAEGVFGTLAEGGIVVAPMGDPDFETELCRSSLRVLGSKFPHPRVFMLNQPSLPGGDWAVAWCSNGHDPAQVIRDPTGVESLQCWHKPLQESLFALPRQVHRLLGLPG